MEEAIAPSVEDFSTTKPSIAVVKRVADLEGTSPEELVPPLYRAIDPDALDSLFAETSHGASGAAGRVSFTYCGYDVSVESDGEITVRES